jgi:hypothetical protein
MNIRSAVGAVKMTFTRCFSTTRQAMPGSGKSIAPSRTTVVMPSTSGA